MLRVRSPITDARHAPGGFSLIELMIAVAIVAILLAVALPMFADSQRKSHRSDAFAALTAGQQAQERWRSNNATYGATTDLNLPTPTPGAGYYSIAVVTDSNTATGYVLTATAVAGTAQAGDSNCQVIAVRMNGGTINYGSSAGGSIDWSDTKRCWVR